MYIQDLPNIVVVGTGLGIDKIPQSLVESKLAGNLTYFVINKSRLWVDPAKLSLRLIESYKKEPRTPGTTEFSQGGAQDALLFYEVIK
jgi:hypothetical protein